VLLIHHSTKDGATYRGASVYRAKCDLMIEVRGRDGNRLLVCDKSKDVKKFSTLTFQLLTHGKSAIVNWLGPAKTEAEKGRDQWKEEAIQILTLSATSPDSAISVSHLLEEMEFKPSRPTLSNFLARLAKDPNSCIQSTKRNVRADEATRGRTAHHYWIKKPEDPN